MDYMASYDNAMALKRIFDRACIKEYGFVPHSYVVNVAGNFVLRSNLKLKVPQ